MANTRRPKGSPDEPAADPRLRVPSKQFRAQLDDRIARGRKLLEEPIADVASFEARQGDFYTWYEYNQRLLERSFDSPAIATEHRHVAMGWPSDRPLNQRVDWLHDDITRDLRRLVSLKEQIDLFDIHPDTASEIVMQTGATSASAGIFIVHGHNDGTKETVARFLSKLLGREPIILHEQPDRGLTIIEKFEHHANQAACAIVLLTADDMGGAVSGDQQPRARQNVVLELGFFLGRLGRRHVVILYEPGVELPSDISGVLYTELDKAGAWHKAVARELNDIGLEINVRALID